VSSLRRDRERIFEQLRQQAAAVATKLAAAAPTTRPFAKMVGKIRLRINIG
jgi:hypothetical protein